MAREEYSLIRDTKADLVNTNEDKVGEARLSEGDVEIDNLFVTLRSELTGNILNLEWDDNDDDGHPISGNAAKAAVDLPYPVEDILSGKRRLTLKTTEKLADLWSSDDFIFEVDLSLPGNDLTGKFQIPLNGGAQVDISSSEGHFLTNQSGLVTIQFTNPLGVYNIAIIPKSQQAFTLNYNSNNDVKRITRIIKWGTNQFTSTANMFKGALNLTHIEPDAGAPSIIGSMSNMFSLCSQFNSDLSGWNVGNVTDTASMFFNCSQFNSDLSGWNVGNVTDMASMFQGCSVFSSDLSGWNVNNVTNMAGMFRGCSQFNSDLSGWAMSNVTDINKMLAQCPKFNSEGFVLNWDLSSVADARAAFYNTALSVTALIINFTNAAGVNWGSVSGGGINNTETVAFKDTKVSGVKLFGNNTDIHLSASSGMSGEALAEMIESFDPAAGKDLTLTNTQKTDLENYLIGEGYTDISDWLTTEGINWNVI